MSVIFEVLYRAPTDRTREERISREVARYGGKLTYREEPSSDSDLSQAICLTYEFPERESAERAADFVRILGEHVESLGDYGND